MYNEGAFMAILALSGFLILLVLVLAIVAYVFSALGLYQLASNRGIENPWLAWIPIANFYILGRLIGNLKVGSFEIPSIELVLPIGVIVTAVLGQFPVVGWLINIAFYALLMIAFYKLYNMYRPESATLWLILSIVLPFMGPIFLFIMRNDKPVAY